MGEWFMGQGLDEGRRCGGRGHMEGRGYMQRGGMWGGGYVSLYALQLVKPLCSH